MLEAALNYARLCWPVGPAHTVVDGVCSCGDEACRSPGKHPRTAHGVKDASTMEADVRRLFGDEAPSNPFIRTGPVAGRTLVVVDIDPRNGGHRALAELEERYGQLPATPTVRTGGGGTHYFFWSQSVLRCSSGRVGQGIDIKADGGYVIAPPSVHLSGRAYEWAVGRGPDVPLAEMPRWLEMLCGKQDAAPADAVGTEVGAGQRNSVLMSVAGSMRRRGLGYGPIVAALAAFNAESCRPPLDTAEVEAVARSAVRYAAGPLEDDPGRIEWGDDEVAPQEEKIVVLGGAELAAALQPVDYLCESLGLVAGGGAPHLLGGYGFSGKTVAAQALVLALAAGRSVWGVWRPRERARVLHVDLEQGDRLTRQRYQRLAYGMGVELEELGDAIGVACMPRLSLAPGEEGRWRDVMAGRDLVVIDSLRAATGGMDENDSAIRGPLDMLGRLGEETGCRALVILHARKGSEQTDDRFVLRGSSAIFDAADCAYVFGAKKNEPIEVKQIKARSHGEPIEDFALVIEDVDEKAGLRVKMFGKELVAQKRAEAERARLAETGRRWGEEIARLLTERPGLGVREIRSALSLRSDLFEAAMAYLGDRVEVRQVKTTGRPKDCHYVNAR